MITKVNEFRQYLKDIAVNEGRGNTQIRFDGESKKETLEEAAEKYGKHNASGYFVEPKIKAFEDGAKWQQERMYSKEEVLNIIDKIKNYNNIKMDRMELSFYDKFIDKIIKK